MLDLAKFEEFADEKLNVTQTVVFVFEKVENIAGEGENADFVFFSLCFKMLTFYTPVEDGTYYGVQLWWVGGLPHSLSGAYLQDYASYSYEISWVDKSHQGGVQCTGTVTLACLYFELSPFVYLHT